jgi:hypothetical protein
MDMDMDLLHVGAVDAAKLDESRRTRVPVPGLHSQFWAPERAPALNSAIGAETAILMDPMKRRCFESIDRPPLAAGPLQ